MNEGICVAYRASGKVSFLCRYAEDESYITAFWGETFSLVDENGKEYDGVSCSDSTELLEIIKERGYGVLYDLNGSFVAAIYDKYNKRLNIINDRFGILPVYILYNNNKEWIIASDVKVIKEKRLCPDYVGIAEYLSFDYCLEDRTFFQNVKYMLPGQELVLSAEGCALRTYFSLPGITYDKKCKSKTDYIDELDELYKNAIKIRREKENVIGLTGGFDSRLILGILGGEGTHTYNFGNLGSGDEVGASELAKKYHTDHHYLTFENIDVVSAAREIIRRCDGQCPWERFYVLYSAKEKAKQKGAVEISGMGGDAISGQKSNFTGIIPFMGKQMAEEHYKKERERLLLHITRGRLSVENTSYYGRVVTDCRNEIRNDFYRATREAEKGETFGNYTMRLKLRTLERRVTASSMWLTGQFLPIRFPIYDYAVLSYFNRLPQKYRYGQNLYIDYIAKKYPAAAEAPHSETGHRVDKGHIIRTDYVTVKNYVVRDLLNKAPAYTNSFGFVNDRIRECKNIKDLISVEKPSAEGVFDISKYAGVDELIEVAFEKGGTAMTLLKNIIHLSLLSEMYFDGNISVFCKK